MKTNKGDGNIEVVKRELKNFKKAPFLKLHALIYIAIVLGQFACGYTLGIAGTAFGNAQTQLGFSDTWLGLLGAGALIGLAGSALMGKLADQFGRKQMLMANMYVFTVLSILQFFSNSPLVLFILRIGLGLMMAIDYTVGNALLIEWLPKEEGPQKQSNLLLYWSLGFALSFLVGNVHVDWHWLLASSAIGSLLAAVFRSVIKIPASPAWLASHGKPKRAQKIVQRRLGPKWGLPKKWFHVKTAKEVSIKTLFSKQYWRQTITGSAFYATQAFAFFGVSIFLPVLLKSMGVTNAFLSGSMYNLALVGGCVIGLLVFNRVGRRPFLLVTFGISAACLFIMALIPNLAGNLLLVIFTVFSVTLSVSLLLDYTYTTELFDVKVRATGVGFVIMMSRFGAAAGTFVLPVVISVAGPAVTMMLCGGVLLLGTGICFFLAPETNPQTSVVKGDSK